MKKISLILLVTCAMCTFTISGSNTGPPKVVDEDNLHEYAVSSDLNATDVIVPYVNHENDLFVVPAAVKIADLNFEQPVPAVIGQPDTKRHFEWLFRTCQKKC